MNDEQKRELADTIDTYFTSNNYKNQYTKESKPLGDQIKKLLAGYDMTEFRTEHVIATITESKSETMNESKLFQICKALNIRGLIKKREYVDLQTLETAIYEGKVDANLLNDAKEITITKKLNVKAIN